MDLTSAQEEFEGETFKKLALAGQRFSGKRFESCIFSKCAFNEAFFMACRFQDCTFTGCDFSMAHLDGCAFSGCRFDHCRLIGINWTETDWARQKTLMIKPVDFHDCVLNHSLFMWMNLKRVAITGCTAQEVDFSEADLTGANCTGTDFHNSRFWHTNLTEADLTDAHDYAISPSLNTLKQTRFSLPEAMSLLYNLDIVLTETGGAPEDLA